MTIFTLFDLISMFREQLTEGFVFIAGIAILNITILSHEALKIGQQICFYSLFESFHFE